MKEVNVKMDVAAMREATPHRTVQLDLLLGLMSKAGQHTLPCLFLYGHTSTGKSLVVSTLMRGMNSRRVFVNCIECSTARAIFEHIICGLTGEHPGPENDFAVSVRCDTMTEFVKLLRVTDFSDTSGTVYIVFERAERLRNMDLNLLPALTRLRELTGLNVCVILMSRLVWEKFRGGHPCLEPYVIHFPAYTKDEMVSILSRAWPPDYSADLYRGYVALVLSVFYSVCRNMSELARIVKLNFAKYVEPIESGELTERATNKLWRNVEPHLKRALQTVYLHEVSSNQWTRMQEASEDSLPSRPAPQGAAVELPFFTKYLLIAAFLASYNPSKSDRRFFVKREAKITKRAQLAAQRRSDRTSNLLLGPKAFPLDRLMAIFYAILEDDVAPTANVFSQVTSLVTLGLMTQVGCVDCLEAPKYKCLVSLDFISSIAKTVNFEVARYLYDLV